MLKDIQFTAELKDPLCFSAAQEFLNFFVKTGGGTSLQQGGLCANGFAGAFFNGEVECGGKTDGA